MSRPVVVQSSRTYDVPIERAFAEVMPVDLTAVFRRSFGPLPAITRIEGQDGAWTTVGQTRTIVLGDGSQVHERLTDVAAPQSFSYVLTEPTGAMKLLVTRVEGRWGFTAAPAGGTTVTWSWRSYPRTPPAVLGLFITGLFWRGYAKRALAELAPMLER